MISKRFLTTLLILISLGLASDVYAAEKQKTAMPPTAVETTQVLQKNWVDSTLATGSLSAFNGTILSSEVEGRITKMYFTEGQEVKEGDLLIEIYPDIIRADLDRAKAQLRKSQLDYQRNLILNKKGYVDAATLDSYLATRDSNKADVSSYEAQLRQRLIRAPFSGKLGVKLVSVGDFVKTGSGMVSLQELDPIRVDFSVPEVYMDKLKAGNKVIITSRSFNGKFEGEIYALDSIIQNNTRMIYARAKVPNPERKLLPGAFVEVTVNFSQPQPVLVIPQTAIVYSSDGNFVYRLIDHKAVKTIIKLGKKIPNNEVIVAQGLSANETIIVGGLQKLHDGAQTMTEQELLQMMKTSAKKA